ncbi:MAG: tryptophan synthase subunit alpha [bacterium]
MNRITTKFKQLRLDKKKALITFITCGDPSLKATEELVLSLEKNGADIIELGVPFSDPLADGPTIQEASQRALKNKVNLTRILQFVKKIRKRTQIPIALMTYYNPVYTFGIGNFAKTALASGVDGLIIPDLPPEEGQGLGILLKGLALIYFLSPTSSPERIKKVARASSGFIYYVSVTGVTGARRDISKNIWGYLMRIRESTTTPIAVGFGISNPQQARAISQYADGVIIGSAIINIIKKNLKNKNLARKVGKFILDLRKAIDE